MEMNELLIITAKRELFEETDVTLYNALHFVGLYDTVNRDPRTRVITATYYTTIPFETAFKAKDDAVDISWIRLDDLNMVNGAFDHKKMIYDAEHMLRVLGKIQQIRYTAIF
jgi:8-oxo-dGTP diphosphatase